MTPLGETAAFQIVNIQSRAKAAILIAGSLADSIIANVLNGNPGTEPVVCTSGPGNTANLEIRYALTLPEC